MLHPPCMQAGTCRVRLWGGYEACGTRCHKRSCRAQCSPSFATQWLPDVTTKKPSDIPIAIGSRVDHACQGPTEPAAPLREGSVGAHQEESKEAVAAALKGS